MSEKTKTVAEVLTDVDNANNLDELCEVYRYMAKNKYKYPLIDLDFIAFYLKRKLGNIKKPPPKAGNYFSRHLHSNLEECIVIGPIRIYDNEKANSN